MNNIHYMDEIAACFEGIRIDVADYLVASGLEPVSIVEKINLLGKREVVTNVDIAIDEICLTHFRHRFPNAVILSEENNAAPLSALSDVDERLLVIVDPIDGTSDFIRGGPNWAVSVAVVRRGHPIAGMLFFPASRTFITGLQYEGHFVVQGQPSMTTIPNRHLAVSPRQATSNQIEAICAATGLSPIVISSLTSKIHVLLKGEAVAAIYLPGFGNSAKLWDYAAAFFILRQIGGSVSSLNPDEPIDFTGQYLLHEGGWLATCRYNSHTAILSIAASVTGGGNA